MPAPADDLTQSEVLRRLAALLLQAGDIPADPDDPCDADYRQGFLAGCCAAAAVAGGAAAGTPTPLNELAALGLDLVKAVDWSEH